jgi:hypothetical protein
MELAVGGRGGTTIAPFGQGGLRVSGILDLGDGLEGRIEGVLHAEDNHKTGLRRMGRDDR